MTATNQEVSIRASMPAAVEESGSAVIPADLLPDILKRLPGDQVSFSTVGLVSSTSAPAMRSTGSTS